MNTNELAKRIARLEAAWRDHEGRQHAVSLAGRYPDPVDYARAVLKLEPIPIIQEVLRSLTQPPFKTLVKSGHNVGKSHAAAMAINWFFDTFAPCAVISTAPTHRDICDVLWKEVRIQRLRAGLSDCFVGRSAPHMRTGPDHYAKGFTARRGESLQGRHDQRMLFVMDEAVGISPIFWQTFKSMFRPEAGHAWLAICNPTDTTSEAYMQECDSGICDPWHTFTLSALEHPNVQRELRGQAPLIASAVSLRQVNSWVADWCEPIRPEVEEIQKTDVEWPPGSAQVVMHGKEHIVWLRPLAGLIVMTQLSYDSQVTKPTALVDQVPPADIVPEEMNLLRTLMTACTPAKFDLARYQDRYALELTQLIETKVAGKEIVAALANEPLPVINLVEALRKSVAEKQKTARTNSPAEAKSPRRKTAAPSRSKTAGRSKKAVATA